MGQSRLLKPKWPGSQSVYPRIVKYPAWAGSLCSVRVRTLDQLVERLDEDLAWRKRELTTLKFMLGRLRDHERRLLLRAAVCILYAHWEGFIKIAASSYVSLIAGRGLRYCDLTPNFVALGFQSEIVQAGRSSGFTSHIELAEKFILGLSRNAEINSKSPVENISNLNSKALAEIIRLLGLDKTEYLLKGQFLDQKLLENRNLISHGRRVDIDLEDYYGMHEEIVGLVQTFRNDIENAAVMENFLALNSMPR